MADRKRKSGNSNSNSTRSRNAEIVAELANELGIHDRPDSPTGQAFVASMATTQPETEIPGPSPEDMETVEGLDDATQSDIGNITEYGTMEAYEGDATEHADVNTDTQPYEDENWATADQEAMSVLDRDIVSSYPDMEASMEEDIRGASEAVSRRNPQWSQQDVNEQTAESVEDMTSQPESSHGISSQTGGTESSVQYRQAFPRRAASEEVASFFRFSGGPFPALFQSNTTSQDNATNQNTTAAQNNPTVGSVYGEPSSTAEPQQATDTDADNDTISDTDADDVSDS